MDYNDILLIGGPIVGGLGATGAYQTIRDMQDINKMASMGNYSPSNPMPQEFMNKLRGAWTPSSTFEKTGYPTGFKNWFFSRSSPQHFGPVEKMMSWGRAGLPYLKQGAKFLRQTPLAGFASDALFGTDTQGSFARDINQALNVPLKKDGTVQRNIKDYRASQGSNVNQGGGNQGGGGRAAIAGGAAGASTPSRPSGYDAVRQYGRARGGLASLWQR